ncbi:MAG TPA: hypothetical protein VK701_06735 [Solirubrobacteraceae bacterium]|jgi:3-hydroxyacyl-[acyl-carrier-protein] dehydratase|nr:hypothetical protein [Solirubrobacteraceae bacterium]
MVERDISSSPRSAALSAAPLHAVEWVKDVVDPSGLLTLRAAKMIDAADPYMAGHFPGFAIYPGVFVLETVVQAAATALGEPVRIVRVHSMRFTAPLCAEDVLTVDSSVRALQTPGEWLVDASCRRLDGTDSARIKIDVRAELLDDA